MHIDLEISKAIDCWMDTEYKHKNVLRNYILKQYCISGTGYVLSFHDTYGMNSTGNTPYS